MLRVFPYCIHCCVLTVTAWFVIHGWVVSIRKGNAATNSFNFCNLSHYNKGQALLQAWVCTVLVYQGGPYLGRGENIFPHAGVLPLATGWVLCVIISTHNAWYYVAVT